MSSGSKFARATGRGQFRPPQNRGLVQLRHGPPSSKKTHLGQGKDASGSINAGNGGIASTSQEESFQLLTHPGTMGRPFAMMIRLQPEILEELKQAEAEGIEPMMKFGANASGHVIQIGHETFKFSSAPEPGDLCDIYEQKKRETGEAFLVEAGSAWRKLSVQRILSATEKDRVKKRTAEAEKKQRQRKSILVDSNTQMIIPQASAAEVNGRKPLPKPKEPPPKKRKVTMSPIPLPQKPKIHTSATPIIQFASPASPAFEPPSSNARATNVNQMGEIHLSKERFMSERPPANKGPSIQKDKIQTPTAVAALDSGKTLSAVNLTDLRNFLIGLLQENPKGVTIKTVEKAVAEGLPAIPDKKALEKVMKSIASYHAPGKYLLNPGVEKGNYLDVVAPNSSGRVQEPGRPSTHEEEPSTSISKKESFKEKVELSSSEMGFLNALSQHSEHFTKDASPGAQVFDSRPDKESLPKQNAADPCSGGSESSSSSGSGSASDSDSDSSDSGSGTDSGSASGTDSEASSSSRGESIDEDVDIMSDDDTEKKTDQKQKPKVREAKLSAKEDVRIQENSISREDTCGNLNSTNPLQQAQTLDEPNDPEPGVTIGVSKSLIESVFGPDEVSASAADAGTRTRGEYVVGGQVKSTHVNYAKAENSRESRERLFFDETQTRGNEVLRVGEELDSLVERVSDLKDVGNSSFVGNKLGFTMTHQEHQKPQLKLAALGSSKDIDKQRMDAEYGNRGIIDKKERGVFTSSDVKSSSKTLSSSLEANRMQPEGSPMGSQKIYEKLSQKQQTSAEAKQPSSKRSITTHKKIERGKTTPEILVRGRSPKDLAKGSSGAATASESAMKLDDERGVAMDVDKGAAEMSEFSEGKQKKERGREERVLEAAKWGESSGKHNKEFEAQHLQQKDSLGHGGLASKVNSYHIAKDSKHLVGGFDRDSPHAEKSNKVHRLSKQTGEAVDRAGSNVEQAERPLKDVESTRRGKDTSGKGVLKEAESVGRPSNGGPSNLVSKDSPHLDGVQGDYGHSSYSHAKRQAWEGSRIPQGSEQGEERDALFENGYLDTRKWPPHTEDVRSKATSRVLPHKSSLSPNQENSQSVGRRPLDMPKQSPVKGIDDPRHYVHDSKNAKRRAEDIEGSEIERPSKRVGAAQIKQPQHNKEEWFQTGSMKDKYREKGRFSGSDSQEYAGGSKYGAFENSARSDEELGDSRELAYRKQGTRQVITSSGGMHRDNLKVDDLLDTTKRQTPQSMEVQECEFFASYEKNKPDLRGSIHNYQEYKQYCKEYHEKYPIYRQLNLAIEQEKKPFESLRKDMERAKFKDDERKLAHTCGKIKEEYMLRRKRCKRMRHTFHILHEELEAIKNRCKEYAEKVGQG